MLITCVLKYSFHVVCTIGYSSPVFSTESFTIQFGDDIVMVMACVLNCSACASLILQFLACVQTELGVIWLTLALLFHHFARRLLLQFAELKMRN